jgi:hypothetical protein
VTLTLAESIFEQLLFLKTLQHLTYIPCGECIYEFASNEKKKKEEN